ncbi:MAG: hypothetical protein AAB360_02880 [Patescibacteria group bacterium]
MACPGAITEVDNIDLRHAVDPVRVVQHRLLERLLGRLGATVGGLIDRLSVSQCDLEETAQIAKRGERIDER